MSDTELLLKSEPVRRLEVFTGAGRRRTWTAEQKLRIVAESYGAGETVSAVARRHGMTPQQLFGWRRAAGRPLATGMGEHGPAFAPAIVEGAPSRASVVQPSRLRCSIFSSIVAWPQQIIKLLTRWYGPVGESVYGIRGSNTPPGSDELSMPFENSPVDRVAGPSARGDRRSIDGRAVGDGAA
jgi:transposase-like protein